MSFKISSARTRPTLELANLLNFLKKSTELYILNTSRDAIYFQQIQMAVLDVLMHKIHLNQKASSNSFSKLINDFDWVYQSLQIRDCNPETSNKLNNTPSPLPRNPEQYLRMWILRNLQENCLCACIQNLIGDPELLECYYENNAYLRNEDYAAALLICLSALELNQYNLLTQINAELYYGTNCKTALQHKRSSSHPRFSVSTPKNPCVLPKSNELDGDKGKRKACNRQSPFRRTKSLIEIHTFTSESNAVPSALRPRSKTVNSDTMRTSESQSEQEKTNRVSKITTKFKNLAAWRGSNNEQNSTNSPRSQFSDSTLNSVSSISSTTPASASIDSIISSTNKAPELRIELIKCDDIKIWTDQKNEQQGADSDSKTETQSFNIPKIEQPIRYTKSFSPINSFLANLFSTPPTYTSWSINQTGSNTNGQAEEPTDIGVTAISSFSSFPCNSNRVEKCNTSVFDSFLPIDGKKFQSRKAKSLFEEGINTLDYSFSTSSCPPKNEQQNEIDDSSNIKGQKNKKPNQNLTLANFLQITQQSHNNTELEKENAHFRISEAIISAIEHMKWAKSGSNQKTPIEGTATDWLERDRSSISGNHEAPVFTQEHILYAEVPENSLELDSLSAEVVGLSLISKFNENHLPKISKLKCLVSEEDAPQKLLPLPDNTTKNPDDHILPSATRGTRYWAPPRQQIIFTDHPTPNLRTLLKIQNYRCAGCGMRVSMQQAHSFRFCSYLGKYHCTGCHRNQIAVIPAKILNSWDFKGYPVSVFSYRLLEKIYTYPLFYLPDLNPALYMRSKQLEGARNKKIQLGYVKDFIKLCRFATREHRFFDAIPAHLTSDPDIWSISDFTDVCNKSLQRSIDDLITRCEYHIFQCELCTARGFICEYCRKSEVIYPWERKVYRCDRCGTCYHNCCWKSVLQVCRKCQRIHQRRDEF